MHAMHACMHACIHATDAGFAFELWQMPLNYGLALTSECTHRLRIAAGCSGFAIYEAQLSFTIKTGCKSLLKEKTYEENRLVLFEQNKKHDLII